MDRPTVLRGRRTFFGNNSLALFSHAVGHDPQHVCDAFAELSLTFHDFFAMGTPGRVQKCHGHCRDGTYKSAHR